MYRSLIPLLMCISAGSAAPQDTSITYIQPPTEQLAVENQTVLRESRIEQLPLTIQEIIGETATEVTADPPTTTTEDLTTETTSTTKPTTLLSRKFTRKPQTPTKVPRFYSKLSYFQKTSNSLSTNLIDDVRVSKRGYESPCRCEKIWNCGPKLQISVHRCPDEYFLCCF